MILDVRHEQACAGPYFVGGFFRVKLNVTHV